MSEQTRPTDDHPEGGRYIDERGHWVNAEGQYIDADGKVVDKPVKAPAPVTAPTDTDAAKKAAEKKAADERAEAERVEAERLRQAAQGRQR